MIDDPKNGNFAAKLRSSWRSIFYAICSGAIPLLKQFLLFDWVSSAEISDTLWTISIIAFFIPLSAMGWSDLGARDAAILEDGHEKLPENGFIFIIFLGISSILFFFGLSLVKGTFAVAAFAAIDLLFMVSFQYALKISRSFGQIETFFKMALSKSFFEIMILFITFSAIGKIKILHVLFIESASIIIILLLYRKEYLYFFTNLKKNFLFTCKLYFVSRWHSALEYVGAAVILSLVAQWDRIFYIKVMSEEAYVRYMFVALNKLALMSLGALIFTALYARFAKIIQTDRTKLGAELGRMLKWALASAVVLVPLQTAIFVLASSEFHIGPKVGWVSVSLAVILGWLHVVQLLEVIFQLAKRTRYIASGSALSFIAFNGSAYILALQGSLTVNTALMIALFARILQILFMILYLPKARLAFDRELQEP